MPSTKKRVGCSEWECTRPADTRGMCHDHYMKWYSKAKADGTFTPITRGRRPLPAGGQMKNRVVRMDDDRWQFVQERGGAEYLRRLVDADRAK